ncbi:MAG: hypothetical protein J6A79_14565 [Clostridia bacterium]|nr:hypothetical protein [Clostridia bacterium]
MKSLRRSIGRMCSAAKQRRSMVWTAGILLLALACMSSWAPAEDTGEWVYGGSAKTDIAVWEALFSSDEAFYDSCM